MQRKKSYSMTEQAGLEVAAKLAGRSADLKLASYAYGELLFRNSKRVAMLAGWPQIVRFDNQAGLSA